MRKYLILALVLIPCYASAELRDCGWEFDAPIQREDGTVITPSEIDFYRVYIGINGPVDTSTPYDSTQTTTYETQLDLPHGSNIVNIQFQTVDTDGSESVLSPVFASTEVVTSPPNPPTNIREIDS